MTCEHSHITPQRYANERRRNGELVRVRCVDCGQSWVEATVGEPRQRNGTVEVTL